MYGLAYLEKCIWETGLKWIPLLKAIVLQISIKAQRLIVHNFFVWVKFDEIISTNYQTSFEVCLPLVHILAIVFEKMYRPQQVMCNSSL